MKNQQLTCVKFNIDKNKKIFLYQGSIQAGRGIEQMIALLHHFENSVACIIGDGEHKHEIIKLTNKLNIANRVFLQEIFRIKSFLMFQNKQT